MRSIKMEHTFELKFIKVSEALPEKDLEECLVITYHPEANVSVLLLTNYNASLKLFNAFDSSEYAFKNVVAWAVVPEELLDYVRSFNLKK